MHSNNAANVTLGLDLGPNSIGWALVDVDNQKLVDMGVRIFPEGVDNFDTAKEAGRAQKRRIARGMRRQTQRRRERKERLVQALRAANLLPQDNAELEQLLGRDPYELRALAVEEQISLHEIGRVILHLNQRRGFKSNSKREQAADKEVKGMLGEIQNLQATIASSNCKTLGQYLFKSLMESPSDRIRNQHTMRDMLQSEFDVIWNKQAEYYPEVLTANLRYGGQGKREIGFKIPEKRQKGKSWADLYGIEGIVFHQRKMYWHRESVGLCEFESKQRRCHKADRIAQKFRIYQEVNNLKFIDPATNEERSLNQQERDFLVEKLSSKKEMLFDAIKKELAKLPDFPSPDQVQFNLERGKRPKLLGMPTDYALANKNLFGKSWWSKSEDERDEIVRSLIDTNRDEDEIEAIAISKWGLSEQQTETVLEWDYDASPHKGHGSLSRKAMTKLLPFLRDGLPLVEGNGIDQNGKPTDAVHAAGYVRPDELKRRIFDRLPMLDRASSLKLGDLPNPVVKRTLAELRKVVNAIVREYGKPAEIHIEMARELKMGQEKRKEYNSRIREREQARNRIKDKLQEYGQRITRDNIIRYECWEQQGTVCAYSGRPITPVQLFSGEVDIDHILPRWKSLDDSQANKVLAYRSENHEKGDRTPYEWLAHTQPAKYDEMMLRMRNCMKQHGLPYSKYSRLSQKNCADDAFATRQLNDTAYLSKVAMEYLKCLMPQSHNVLGLKGAHTAELRRQWGLNSILRSDELDLKNRDDHRHHAVDAVVVALTDRGMLQRLSNGYREHLAVHVGTGEYEHVQTYQGGSIKDPWDDFRTDIEQRANTINVSHRPERKVAGALHEETLYGPVYNQKRDRIDGEFVVRKPIDQLSANEIEAIRDKSVRLAVIKRLEEFGVEYGRGKKPDLKLMKQALGDPENPVMMPTKPGNEQNAVPIRKVRLLRKERTIQPIRTKRAEKLKNNDVIAFVKPGSTHHISLFEYTDDKDNLKNDAVFTTMLEASQKVSGIKKNIKGEQLIVREHPDIADAKFMYSLSRREMVLAKDKDGMERLLVFKTASSTTKQMIFVEHRDARREYKKISATPNTLNARKVTVDLLGRIRWASD